MGSKASRQPATQRRRLSAQLLIEHSRHTICLAELEVNIFRHQWKSSGAGDGGGTARARTHVATDGARRQRQGGGAGVGGEAFSIYLRSKEVIAINLHGQQTKPITSNVFSLESLGTIERRSGWQGAPSQLTTRLNIITWGVP